MSEKKISSEIPSSNKHSDSSQTHLILGLARSGKAVASFFERNGTPYIVYDDKGIADRNASAEPNAIVLDQMDQIDWDKIAVVVQSPGVPFSFPTPHPITAMAQQRGIPIKTDIDLFNENRPIKKLCVGITGTNGKSTTTALITHILNENGLKAEMGGNIGVPALTLLDQPEISVYVLELSSFQLEATQRIDLDVAVITNIAEDHLDRHGSMENYIKAKQRIFNHASHCLVGSDCPDIGIGPSSIASLQGAHNQENMRIAYAVCAKLGLSDAGIRQAIQTFPGLSHRMELVYTCSDFFIVNDSKATNADSTRRALDHYTADSNIHIYWIAGGKSKQGGIESLAPFFKTIKKAYFIGAAQEAFLKIAEGSLDAKACFDLETAVKAAFADIRAEARLNTSMGRDLKRRYLMLFSPACASFDQFIDFEDRGETFKKIACSNLKKRA